MITCSGAGFFFVHVPKNGGSSVRDQIQGYDDFSGRFLGTKAHETLGLYDSSHVPLAVLRDHFADAFDAICRLDGYCILRDPVDRFASSLAQRFRQIHGKQPGQVGAAEARAELNAVVDALRCSEGRLHHTFSHFTPQVDFIELDGERLVRHVYSIGDMRRLLRDLSERLGTRLVQDFHSNKTVTFRHNRLAGPMILAKDFLKRHAPASVVHPVRRVAMRMLTAPRVRVIDDQVYGSDETMAFVRDYYRRDFEIFRAVAAAP